MAEILVVDDDRALREGLRRILKREGFSVRLAKSGAEALTLVRDHEPDLVLLDVMMPRMDGFDVCAALRAANARLPILFLTGAGDESNEVRGLDAGADDFIPKSAGERALLARIRRALGRVASLEAAEDRMLQLGRVVVDGLTRTVRLPDAPPVALTRAELNILRALAAARGRYFSCRELAEAMHGEGYRCEDATLRSQVSRLRRKLGPAGELIRGEQGFGYKLLP